MKSFVDSFKLTSSGGESGAILLVRTRIVRTLGAVYLSVGADHDLCKRAEVDESDAIALMCR